MLPPPAPVHAGVGNALDVGVLPPSHVPAGVGDVLVVGVLPSPSRVHAGVGDGGNTRTIVSWKLKFVIV